MVQFWSSLATGDTRLMTHVLREFPRKPVNTAWATYIRCHDDIGWAVTEADAEAVGDAPAHREFLSDFYPASTRLRPLGGSAQPSDRRPPDLGPMASLAGLERG
jgi:amylosucrase